MEFGCNSRLHKTKYFLRRKIQKIPTEISDDCYKHSKRFRRSFLKLPTEQDPNNFDGDSRRFQRKFQIMLKDFPDDWNLLHRKRSGNSVRIIWNFLKETDSDHFYSKQDKLDSVYCAIFEFNVQTRQWLSLCLCLY